MATGDGGRMGSFVKHDVLKSFNGEGDVVAWLQKAELVAKLTKISDLASFVPLYLEEGALAVYLEMDSGEQKNFEMIKKRLREAFTDNDFMSYCKLRESRWMGEAVDVYANELRRLARTCGLVGEGLEKVVRLAFVTGFPESISLELQQVAGVDRISVSELIGRARILTANRGGGGVGFSAPALTDRGTKSFVKGCFRCGGSHLLRDCPNESASSNKRRSIVCYRCGGEGHIAAYCTHEVTKGRSKSVTGNISAGAASDVAGVPMIKITVEGKPRRALVDTGCSNSMIRVGLVDSWEGTICTKAFDGRIVKGKGTANVEFVIDGRKVTTRSTVVDKLVGDVDVVLGMDVIRQLGGVKVGQHSVEFGKRMACTSINPGGKHELLTVKDKDFEATFDGHVWTVKYFWKNNKAPVLRNRTAVYHHNMKAETVARFNQEVEKWIGDGILMPWDEEVNEGFIPLMAVEQPTKDKVRPVLDFRELNEAVECHTGDNLIDVCGDVLRQWRQVEGETEIVDLKAAYLQVHVSPELWKYQLVKFKGKTYCLTRLGFGLNCAPRIMTKVLKDVLGLREDIKNSTSSYVDDILVNVSQIGSDEVISHLKDYGLAAKPAEKLEGGTALGLRLSRSSAGVLCFERSGELPPVDHQLTKRELFSLCGKLTAHYPIAGWLRLACSYVKRHAGVDKWDSYIGMGAQTMVKEIMQRVKADDPVRGQWEVAPSIEGTIWCDASDLCEGVMLEIDGIPVEDAAWMRKSDDHNHINVAELEAVLKGVNLGLKWGLKKIRIMTDSVTVRQWVVLTLSEERRIRTTSASEILVKRRLGVLKELVEELELEVQVQVVASKDNKADALTRVKRDWKELDKRSELEGPSCAAVGITPKELHDQHHFGVERSWYLARQVNPGITKDQMKKVVKNCTRCQSIDPPPVRHTIGELSVNNNWVRLAIDVTHFHGTPYLSMVDCGPGRFAIWRRLRNEQTEQLVAELRQVFYERGPVDQVLMDNAPAFKSKLFLDFLAEWNVQPYFRAAYRPSGNGIVERNHRTIKAIAERGQISPEQAVYFYNCSPRDRQEEASVPQRSVMSYGWRLPIVAPDEGEESKQSATVSVGEEVWVKPPESRCTSRWDQGVVTKVNSSNNVEVNHMPRHILDVRPVRGNEMEDLCRDQIQEEPMRYPQRNRQAPVWHRDYEMERN